MLVLTRRDGEGVMVGDDVKVIVLGRHGAEVKLGIQAPPSVAVHRKEVWDRIQAGQRPRQKLRLAREAETARPRLTRGQLEVLVAGRDGEAPWYLDRDLHTRWYENGEFEAIAELAAEILELRGRVDDLEKRRAS